MKIRNGKYAQRKAISPIIATVLIIAVTLIAAVAIGGFVFGIFGSSSNAAQTSVTQQSLVAADFSGGSAAGSVTCSNAAAGSLSFGLGVSNTGTAAASVTGVTITYAGAVNSYTVSGACTISAAGNAGVSATPTVGNPMYIDFTSGTSGMTVQPTAGQTYTGTVTMSNGAVLIFTGSFQ